MNIDTIEPIPGGYALSATRSGVEGIVDKQALIEAMAEKYSANKKLQDIVLNAVRNAGNGADEQLYAWERWLEKLPYRREPGEILRNPLECAKLGGDCDDLTLLAMAGCKALGIPCMSEVVTDSERNGFHIRCVAALPPLNPSFTVVIDPVYRSEPQWAMAETDKALASQKFTGVIHNDPRLSGTMKITGLDYTWIAKAAAVFIAGWLIISRKKT